MSYEGLIITTTGHKRTRVCGFSLLNIGNADNVSQDHDRLTIFIKSRLEFCSSTVMTRKLIRPLLHEIEVSFVPCNSLESCRKILEMCTRLATCGRVESPSSVEKSKSMTCIIRGVSMLSSLERLREFQKMFL